MHDEAVSGWPNSSLDGKSTLLPAGSNQEAARLARLARERLAALGKISGADEIMLSDGNAAGTGDLVRARLNTKIDAGGQTLSNRDTIKIAGWQGSGSGRSAVVVRQTSGGWSSSFLVPAAYRGAGTNGPASTAQASSLPELP